MHTPHHGGVLWGQLSECLWSAAVLAIVRVPPPHLLASVCGLGGLTLPPWKAEALLKGDCRIACDDFL